MDELKSLNEKVDALIRHYKASQASVKKLTATIAKKDEEVARLKETIADLKEQTLAYAAGAVINTPAERTRVRKQLDTVIGEIDKILTSFND